MLNATQLLSAMMMPAVLIRLVDQQWCVLAQNQLATDKWGAFAESELTQMIEALDLCWYEGKSTVRRRMDYSDKKQLINTVFLPVSLSDGRAILLHAVPVPTDQLRLPISERDNLAMRCNLIVAGSKGGIYDWNILDDRVYWSDRMNAILGASSYQLLGTADAFWQRVHPDDKTLVEDALQGHLIHCWPFDVECRVRTDAGYYVD